ncbi:uncharacterized mitochondrial protein AtMg00810-like [Ricinus communis]|uniref:uncharacterized mitochondrial protein AtMg00810-like n=1 Tax=Ricinus communis TaxID=3988 RepID=UPI00201AE8B0|nr:uncharacterized mitochondrial protein AtMg00810-like [Ricinus communis]
MEMKIRLNLKDDDPLSDIGHYQHLVGKLIYLTITKPDISYIVSMISQFMHAPRTPHLDAVDRILRYLKGTPGQDWAGSCDRKSTSGFYVFVEGNLGKSLIGRNCNSICQKPRTAADIFTKALDKASHQRLLSKMGSVNLFEPTLRGSVEAPDHSCKVQ